MLPSMRFTHQLFNFMAACFPFGGFSSQQCPAQQLTGPHEGTPSQS